MLKTPCELVRWEILSAIRRALVKDLIEKGLKRQEVAEIFELSEAAISQYFKNKRGSNYPISPELQKEIFRVSDMILERKKERKTVLLSGICYLCGIVKNETENPDPNFAQHSCLFDIGAMNRIIDDLKNGDNI